MAQVVSQSFTSKAVSADKKIGCPLGKPVGVIQLVHGHG